MNVLALPAAARFSEKSQLAIRIPTTSLNPTSLVERPPRDQVTIGKLIVRLLPEQFNRCFQLIRNAFVSIQTKDPFMLSSIRCELLLCGEPRPLPTYNSSSGL